MRTTLAIDDDVLALAKALAQEQSKSVGEIISALARQALQPRIRGDDIRNGVPLLPAGDDARPVTLELVNRLREEFGG